MSNEIVAVKPVDFSTIFERSVSENNPPIEETIKVDNNAADNNADKADETREASSIEVDDFDENMIFALTPETCPGPALSSSASTQDPAADIRRDVEYGSRRPFRAPPTRPIHRR